MRCSRLPGVHSVEIGTVAGRWETSSAGRRPFAKKGSVMGTTKKVRLSRVTDLLDGKVLPTARTVETEQFTAR